MSDENLPADERPQAPRDDSKPRLGAPLSVLWWEEPGEPSAEE